MSTTTVKNLVSTVVGVEPKSVKTEPAAYKQATIRLGIEATFGLMEEIYEKTRVVNGEANPNFEADFTNAMITMMINVEEGLTEYNK